MARKPSASGAAALRYLGPNTAFDHDGGEVILVNGQVYDDLPTDHPIIENLRARELLIDVDPTETPTPAAPETEL